MRGVLLIALVAALASVAVAQENSTLPLAAQRQDLDLGSNKPATPAAAPPASPPAAAPPAAAPKPAEKKHHHRRPLNQIVYVTVNKQQQWQNEEQRVKWLERHHRHRHHHKEEEVEADGKKDGKLSEAEIARLQKKDERLVGRIRAINEKLNKLMQKLHTDEKLYKPDAKQRHQLSKTQKTVKKLRIVRRKLLMARPQRADPPKEQHDKLNKVNKDIKGVLVKLSKKDLPENDYKSLVGKLKDLRKERVSIYQVFNKQPIIAAKRKKALRPNSTIPLPSLVKKHGKKGKKAAKKGKKHAKKHGKKHAKKHAKKGKKHSKKGKKHHKKHAKKHHKKRHHKRHHKKRHHDAEVVVKARVAPKGSLRGHHHGRKFHKRHHRHHKQRMIVFASQPRRQPHHRVHIRRTYVARRHHRPQQQQQERRRRHHHKRRLNRADDDEDSEDGRVIAAHGPNVLSAQADEEEEDADVDLLPSNLQDEAQQYLDGLDKDE